MAISSGPTAFAERNDNLTVNPPPALTSLTIPAGDDRILIVSVAIIGITGGSPPTVTGITWGAQALAQLDGAAAQMDHQNIAGTKECRIELWALVAPNVGANNIVVTLSGTAAGARMHVIAHSWTGVHQTTPFGTWAEATGSPAGTAITPTVNVSSAADEIVIGQMASTYDGSGGGYQTTDPITGAGQTGIRFELMNIGHARDAASASSYETGAGTTTFSYGLTSANSVTHHWVIGAVPLKPSATASAPVDASAAIVELRISPLRAAPSNSHYPEEADESDVDHYALQWGISGAYPLIFRARLNDDDSELILESLWALDSMAPAGAMAITQLPVPSARQSLIATTQDKVIQYPLPLTLEPHLLQYPDTIRSGEGVPVATKFSEWNDGRGPYQLHGFHVLTSNLDKQVDFVGIAWVWDDWNTWTPFQWQSGDDLWFSWKGRNAGHRLKAYIALYDASSDDPVVPGIISVKPYLSPTSKPLQTPGGYTISGREPEPQ